MRTTDDRVVKLAEALKALGHPVRIEILRIINGSAKGELTVTQIHERLGITQPEASRHLSVLRNHSILICEKKDGYSYYGINAQPGYISEILNSLKRK